MTRMAIHSARPGAKDTGSEVCLCDVPVADLVYAQRQAALPASYGLVLHGAFGHLTAHVLNACSAADRGRSFDELTDASPRAVWKKIIR